MPPKKSKKGSLKLQDMSAASSSAPTQAVASPATASPSPISPISSRPDGRSPVRSFTFDSVLHRSSTKTPSLEQADPDAGNVLRQTKTAPVISKRHKSDGAVIAPSTTPTDAFFQKRRKETGSLDHYGRHANDWLFGGLGIRETAKSIISRQNSR
ncbi:uncharacterized protein AB675_11601 [Cyphellophora attinorum]|uniref:Uncharacterized protein n=1 Tax=Cyphellophora attinorum TaxID=1664694 RepID=A0A0N0NM13_9EURO|nr:uncharacterized protein AB675_11601 [Phialophora attinorum]KPI39931.1 hypothetical protein AB675_11601 [Phialophora attinorum]